MEKICKICGESKNILKFKKGKTYKGGFGPTCFSCQNEKYYKKISLQCPLNVRISWWKSHAKARGIEWSISDEEISHIPLVCHYTNTNLVMEPNKINTVSIERLDSCKGYVSGNVVFCLDYVNTLKGTTSKSVFIEKCKAIASSDFVDACNKVAVNF